MFRIVAALSILTLIAACGSGTRYSSNNAVGARMSGSSSVQFANGPIAQACMRAGRKQSSRSKCGCVQAVANRSLSRAEQQRGASFFANPQRAQDTRQSDNPASERLWRNWKDFGVSAAKQCG